MRLGLIDVPIAIDAVSSLPVVTVAVVVTVAPMPVVVLPVVLPVLLETQKTPVVAFERASTSFLLLFMIDPEVAGGGAS